MYTGKKRLSARQIIRPRRLNLSLHVAQDRSPIQEETANIAPDCSAVLGSKVLFLKQLSASIFNVVDHHACPHWSRCGHFNPPRSKFGNDTVHVANVPALTQGTGQTRLFNSAKSCQALRTNRDGATKAKNFCRVIGAHANVLRATKHLQGSAPGSEIHSTAPLCRVLR